MSVATILDKINPSLKKANYIISSLLILIVFFVVMIHLNKEIRDLDIWLHLKTGEQIVLNKEIPLNDSFSFTKEGQPWINHEWLFQLVAYSLYNQFGFDGLIVMQNIVFLAIFFVLLAMGLRNKNFIFLSVLLYLLVLNISYRFTIRPDMFSALFLVVFVYILMEKRRYLNMLPLLQVIWSNLHGFFFLGPLLILIFCLKERKRQIWVVFLLSLFATVINPQLVKGAIYPLTTVFGIAKDRFIFEFVQELKKPITFQTLFNFKDWVFYKALIFISIFSFRFNQKKFNLALFLLWMVFLLASLLALRNIVYFALVSIIVIFYNTKQRLSYDSSFSNEKYEKNRFYYIGRYSLIFAFGFCMIKNAQMNIDCRYFDFDKYNFKSCLWGTSLRNFPEKAVDFILKEKLPERMYNDFNSGSYLIGHTHPPRRVFIDGRTEFYGDSFLRNYKKVADGDEDSIQRLIKQYDLEGFLLTMAMSNFDEKLAKYLFESVQWKLIYFDDSALIFLKDTRNNKSLIDKHSIDLKAWKAPEEKLGKIPPTRIFPYKNISRGRALKEIGCYEAAISEARAALKVMPNCIDAYALLGGCYFELKEYNLALENLRLAVAFAPRALTLRNKYALALYNSGYLNEAEMQLIKLIKLKPKDSENYQTLAKVYKKLGQLNKAEEMINKACKYSENKDFDSLKFWADLLWELNRPEDSLKAYKLAQQIQPENEEIKNSIKKIEKIL